MCPPWPEMRGDSAAVIVMKAAAGKRLLTEEREALAYAAVRMPATFGAVVKALDYALDAVDFVPKTVLDIGAGTGAAGWAAESLINLDSLVCLEREAVMLRLGQKLMRNSGIPGFGKCGLAAGGFNRRGVGGRG